MGQTSLQVLQTASSATNRSNDVSSMAAVTQASKVGVENGSGWPGLALGEPARSLCGRALAGGDIRTGLGGATRKRAGYHAGRGLAMRSWANRRLGALRNAVPLRVYLLMSMGISRRK